MRARLGGLKHLTCLASLSSLAACALLIGVDEGIDRGAEAGGAGTACDGAGQCVPCDEGSDCDSGVCADRTCQAPSCGDQVKNGPETDVDCGGGCPPCAVGERCEQDSDCVTNHCHPSKKCK